MEQNVKNWNILSNKEINYFIEKFKNQQGQNCPCSNQIVLCGIFTNLKKANSILRPPNYLLKYTGKLRTEWVNKDYTERWRLFSPDSYDMRGYRFYKIKIDRNINKDRFYQNILPYCGFYCTEMEFI